MQLKTTAEFTRAYQALNAGQKQAVDTLENPVMVVAGPGTGKTQVLTTRIANILLKTDTNPSSILALTYTDSAAKTMRQRLAQLIGKTAYYVHISTFHAFCAEVIRSNPEYFEIARDSQPLTELERYELFQSIVDANDLDYIKPLNRPYHFLREIIKNISDLKREGINVKQFKQILQEEAEALEEIKAFSDTAPKKDKLTQTELKKRQKNLHKQQELLVLYQDYQQELNNRQRYDFDDMIMLVVEAFRTHELLLREYQEKLQYFLVDEYQDTNSSQNEVVDLLASYWAPNANIFVVGDPHQAIYRFQGASIENMLSFVDRYPNSTVISLDLGYRCPQTIYDSAHSVISNNQLSQAEVLKSNDKQISKKAKQQLLKLLDQPLKSADNSSKSRPLVKVFSAPVQTLETIFVARQIKHLIDQGIDPDQIAVLYRYNSDSVEMSQALTKWGIRYEIDGGDDILKSEFIDQLFNFFQVLVDLRDSKEDELVYRIMHYPWFELDSLTVMKLARVAGKLDMSLLEVVDRGYEFVIKNKLHKILSEAEFTLVSQFVKNLYEFSSLDHSLTFTHWFERVLKESGLFTWVRSHSQQVELLNELNSLYNQIKSMVAQDHQFKLADFLKAIEVMKEHNLKITVEDLNIKQGSVHLSTVHRAKGQEWQHVFIIHCVDKKWGNHRNIDILPLPERILQNTDVSKKEANEDERRTFYVALTRASKSVTISYPETVIQDNRTDEKSPSLFLEELGSVKQIQDEQLTSKADEFLQRFLEPPAKRKPSTNEKQFFQNIIKDFKLSVTGLNSYLRDPKEFVENNLLRLPRAKPLPMAFGSAVHEALDEYYQIYLQTGAKTSREQLLADFKKALKKEVLTKEEFVSRLKYGNKILSNYHEKTAQEQPQVIETERLIGYGWSKAVLDKDIQLSGKIDRIDWIDQSKKLVRVIDYKTGKPKTEGYINGLTKAVGLSEREQNLPESIRGPYKRQLIFYKLLTQLDQTFNAEVVEGVFEFIEPYKKDDLRLMPRSFTITQEEVNDLKKLIREVMREIKGLEFLKIV